MKCKTCGTDHRGVAKHGGYCLDHQEQRAEASEARAAQAEQERDEAITQRAFWFRRFNEISFEYEGQYSVLLNTANIITAERGRCWMQHDPGDADQNHVTAREQ